MTDTSLPYAAPGSARSSEHDRAARPEAMMLLVCFLVLTFIFTFRLFGSLDGGIVDPDYYWHVKTGEWIVLHGMLPQGDIFSYSVEGKAWNLHEWLFQVLLYGLHVLGGEDLILVVSALLGAAALTVCISVANERIRNPFLGLLLVLLMLSAYMVFVVPRPHLFTYLFFALMLRGLWRARYQDRLRGLFLIPLLMPLWVNLHGGYFIALAFFFCFAALETIRLYLGERDRRPEGAYLKALWASAVISLFGSFLNPEGPAHLLYPLYVMGQSASQSFIAEWASFDFHEFMARWYLVALLTFFALVISRARRPDLTETAIPLLTVLAGLTSMRHAPFTVMVMIVFAGEAIGAGALEPLKAAWRRTLQTRGLHFLKRDASKAGEDLSPRAETILLSAVSCLLVIAVAGAMLLPKHFQKTEPIWTDLVTFIQDNDLQGPMLNQYGLGGFLIHELYPERRVYIDGRADLYGDDFIDRYEEMIAGRPEWREVFEAGNFSYVIMNKKIPLVALLDLHPDYAKAFESEEGMTIYLRRGPGHDGLIEAFRAKSLKNRE